MNFRQATETYSIVSCSTRDTSTLDFIQKGKGQIEPNQTKYEQILIKIGQCELPSIAKSKTKP